jgi:hypothetical protein
LRAALRTSVDYRFCHARQYVSEPGRFLGVSPAVIKLTHYPLLHERRALPSNKLVLRQRPSQACDTNIQGDTATVLGSGGRADLTVFGHSDCSNEDSAKRKHRDHNQPNQGRS